MSSPSKEKKGIFTAWLEQLQQESWQLELLISGFALFGIHKSKDLIFTFQEYLTFEYSSPIYSLFHQVLAVGWKIFFFNLLVHVILRGLWIGAIGLRYVSGGIDFDSLGYSPYFTDYLKKSVGDYDDFIEELEKICSVIFSYTFLLFLFFVSIMSTTFFVSLPMQIAKVFGLEIGEGLGTLFLGFYAIAYVLIGLIVFIDFLTIGAFKKIDDPTVAKIYSWIYIFYSITTLTFLYRPLIYNFIDNKYTRPLFYFSIPYILAILFYNKAFTTHSFPHLPNEDDLRKQGLVVNDYWYEDLAEKQIARSTELDEEAKYKLQLPHVILSAYNMKEPFASILVRIYPDDSKLLKEKMDIPPIHKTGLTFSLFSEKLEPDSIREDIEASFFDQMMEFSRESRAMRDSIKRNRKSKEKKKVFRKHRDSVRQEFTNVVELKQQSLLEYDQEKQTRILEAYTSFIQISIDSVDYTDSLTCRFSKTDNSHKRALRCNFPIRYLDTGNHTLTFNRTLYSRSSRDSTRTRTYKLPFVKQF
ncbi:MAG: hypothetical protein AB8F74_15825 [Saprospiraceae bacterium]